MSPAARAWRSPSSQSPAATIWPTRSPSARPRTIASVREARVEGISAGFRSCSLSTRAESRLSARQSRNGAAAGGGAAGAASSARKAKLFSILGPYRAAYSRNGSSAPNINPLKVRKRLRSLAPALEGAAGGAIEQLVCLPHGERTARGQIVQFVPTDRRGHRCAFAGAGGVRQDRRRPALVAEVIEEDPALAARLGEVSGEALRLGGGERDRETLGEVLHRRPLGLGSERGDDVEPL